MLDNNKSLKRLQVDKDKTKTLVILAIAAALTVFALVTAKGLWSRASYLSKVNGKKEQAVKQLKSNQDSVASLRDSYRKFVDQNPNLLGGNIEGNSDRDGDNGTLVLDALPSKYDFPALASSLEKLLSGYDITGITGTDDIAAHASATPGAPMEIPFSFSVQTDYNGFKQLTRTMNRSIRPFHFTTLDMTGSNNGMTVSLQGKTFYQLEQGVEITEETVQ